MSVFWSQISTANPAELLWLSILIFCNGHIWCQVPDPSFFSWKLGYAKIATSATVPFQMLLDMAMLEIKETPQWPEANWHVAIHLNKWVWKWWERKQQAKPFTSLIAATATNLSSALLLSSWKARLWQPSQASDTSRDTLSCQLLCCLLPWWNNEENLSHSFQQQLPLPSRARQGCT